MNVFKKWSFQVLLTAMILTMAGCKKSEPPIEVPEPGTTEGQKFET